MSQAARAIPVILLGVCLFAAPSRAQPDADTHLESYLTDHELWGVLGAHLRRQMAEGDASTRLGAAEQLGRLYVRMLTEATTREAREQLERHARALLAQVPEAESFELRMNLAKAEYLPVEEIVEQDRLRMAGEDDRAEALRVLRHVGPQLDEIATKVGRRVEQLERRETQVTDDAAEALRTELADARRVRSLARYYAGWARYYTAVLSNQPATAARALEDFGFILNAVPGKAASVERVPENLLRFEHVARAAIGCALCNSLLGRDNEANRWLDAVETAEGVPPSVTEQLFSRRLLVYAAAARWADADALVRAHRRGPDNAPRALTVAEARLLAVLALQAPSNASLRPGTRAAAERLAQEALGDLVRQGEIGHILSLVRLFGTAPIGDSGFIVSYVAGLQDYEQARAAHQATGTSADRPATDPALINHYRQAAGLLQGAISSTDAPAFPQELPRALIRQGLALYYAGDLLRAAAVFESASEKSASGASRRDALWYAIVALDRAIEEGLLSAVEPRDRIATLYLREFPGTDEAARLILRQAGADRLSDRQSIDILLKVPPDSPLHQAARRQAARLLYQQYRRTSGSERDFAAVRFADVAEPIARAAHQSALAATDEPAREAAAAFLLHSRQLLDALLGVTSPDLQRVESIFSMLDAVAAFHGLDLAPIRAELTFRRLQVALAKGDEAGAQSLVDDLRATPDATYSLAADRLMFRRALDRERLDPDSAVHARQIVRHGVRLLDHAGPGASDPVSLTVREAVAAAAFRLHASTPDPLMRDLSIRLDREQLELGKRTAPSLRRLAELLEQTSEPEPARALWEELLQGLPPKSLAWYEARYHSLRLLARAAPADAATALRQHRLLNPEPGPEPWATRLRELEGNLPAPAPREGSK